VTPTAQCAYELRNSGIVAMTKRAVHTSQARSPRAQPPFPGLGGSSFAAMHSAGAPPRRLRPARPDDLDELVRVNLAAFRAGNAPALSQDAAAQLSIDAARAQWRQFLEHQPAGATTTVAELAGRLCGFAGAGPTRDDDLDPSIGELYSLYVDPHLWTQGHGTALHHAALDQLVRSGFASAALWVLEGNERSRRFYRARGWEPDGAQRPFMGANSLRLRHTLSAEPSRGQWRRGKRPDVFR